ncbi:hypothetical protein CSOJ01_14270 [Colletotrichum sojae]|uniref:Uncharacterized protein n=1 Tax=Colletotrichum sojae TaxID=2175907 RepID=A0A8H6MK17_9PEZI|nr:hypothetical protein CSOJ01_14270 [Colletotrichum sojae]
MRGDGDAACDGAGSRMQDRRRCGTNSGGSAPIAQSEFHPTADKALHGAADRIESIQRLRAAGTDGGFSKRSINAMLLRVMRSCGTSRTSVDEREGRDLISPNRILDDAPPSSAHSLASAPGSADHPGPALSISLTARGRDDG